MEEMCIIRIYISLICFNGASRYWEISSWNFVW